MPPQQPWGSRGYSAARPCPVAAPCGAALAFNVGGLNAALRGLVATQSPQLTEQPAGPIPGTAQTVVLCLFEADFGAGQPPSTRPARFEFACATGEAARSALVDASSVALVSSGAGASGGRLQLALAAGACSWR